MNKKTLTFIIILLSLFQAFGQLGKVISGEKIKMKDSFHFNPIVSKNNTISGEWKNGQKINYETGITQFHLVNNQNLQYDLFIEKNGNSFLTITLGSKINIPNSFLKKQLLTSDTSIWFFKSENNDYHTLLIKENNWKIKSNQNVKSRNHSKRIPKPEERLRMIVGAECFDGTISESTGKGTCSHHGGVRYWLFEEE